MMHNLRHGPERAAAPNWQALTGIMRPLTRHHRAGCRRWAVRELGILRDPQALDDLMSALADDQPLVRSEACASLSMLGQAVPAARQPIRTGTIRTLVAAVVPASVTVLGVAAAADW